MNRREFMEQLERLLRDIPRQDREEALEYYENYFEDAGAENEDAVIRELGSPGRIAAEIKATLKDDRSSKPRKKGGTLLIIILFIVTCPLWLAVLGAVGSLIVGILGILFGLVLGSLFGGIGLLVAAVAIAAGGVMYIATSSGLGIAAIGIGMICLAVAIILLLVFGWLVTKAIPAAVRFVVDMAQRLIYRLKGGDR